MKKLFFSLAKVITLLGCMIRLGFRRGDSAELAVLELVDYNIGTGMVKPKKEKTKEVAEQQVAS